MMLTILLNSISLTALFFVSLWLLYLNYRLLQVTKDIHSLTEHIDLVSIELRDLTQEMVYSLAMPNNPNQE